MGMGTSTFVIRWVNLLTMVRPSSSSFSLCFSNQKIWFSFSGIRFLVSVQLTQVMVLSNLVKIPLHDVLKVSTFWFFVSGNSIVIVFVWVEAIGCGSDNIWGVDEYTQRWMQKVPYVSCLSSRWFHLRHVRVFTQQRFLVIMSFPTSCSFKFEMYFLLQIHNRVSWRLQEKRGASLDCILHFLFCFCYWILDLSLTWWWFLLLKYLVVLLIVLIAILVFTVLA